VFLHHSVRIDEGWIDYNTYMKKPIFLVLLATLLAACGGEVGLSSLVEGDVAINLLISNTYNTATQDLSSPVFSLNDNPDLLIFDVPTDLEPGFTLSKYIKVRNEGNVGINYGGTLTLNAPLLGQVFWFSMKDMDPSVTTSIFDTKDQSFVQGHQFVLPSRPLVTRNEFDIFHLQLIVNPGLSNEFNVEGEMYQLDFNMSFTANYIES
jgi:hypothetical protein